MHLRTVNAVTRPEIENHALLHINSNQDSIATRDSDKNVMMLVWKAALDEYRAGDPHSIITLLRAELRCYERLIDRKPAYHSASRQVRIEPIPQADRVRAILNQLADDFGRERVWYKDQSVRLTHG